MYDFNPARFIRKLYSIVENPAYPYIAWGESGRSFVITDKRQFTAEALSKICRTDDYSTFIRQLNNYGFAKSKGDAPSIDEFSNPKFIRGRQDLLTTIKRKGAPEEKRMAAEIQTIKADQVTLQNNILHLDNINRKLLNEIYFLKEKVEMQERTINELIRAFLSVFKNRRIEGERRQLEGDGAGDDPLDLNELLKYKEKPEKREELEDLSDFLNIEEE
jgi:HSF-type DNA-binding